MTTVHHRQVIETEEGKYITIPDGDKATESEIIKYKAAIEIERRRHHE
ncbi:hypothetical protein KAT92_06290 [Candidatus Babeliales bacterium]|nr:hypothetical protein [Candidatus Babeliales bacterium]